MIAAVKLTSVTSVISIDDKASLEEADEDNKINKIAFWKDFSRNMSTTSNVFSNAKKSSTYSSWEY